jgi:hypothetical protein
MSVRPSVRTEQIGSHWTDFHEMLYLIIFRKTVEKIQVTLALSDPTSALTRALSIQKYHYY